MLSKVIWYVVEILFKILHCLSLRNVALCPYPLQSSHGKNVRPSPRMDRVCRRNLTEVREDIDKIQIKKKAQT